MSRPNIGEDTLAQFKSAEEKAAYYQRLAAIAGEARHAYAEQRRRFKGFDLVRVDDVAGMTVAIYVKPEKQRNSR